MFNGIEQEIPYMNKASDIKRLTKGFSKDEKFVLDDKYLIRLFPLEDAKYRRNEFETIRALSSLSVFVPEAIEFGVQEKLGLAFMVLTYLPGCDGEEALCSMTERDQYLVGFQAGMELKKLHEYPAPEGTVPWSVSKKRKNDRYIEELILLEDIDKEIISNLINYIRSNEYLMKGRPNRFQHDDFHPCNLIMEGMEFTGFIDFQRMDWGDPLHDLQKLGFFGVKVSVPFSIGAIDGYNGGEKISEEFWRLFALYSAMHVVSAFVWGKKMGEEQFELLYNYAMDVLRDHDDFRESIPRWYREMI
ncbi:aminoglycoside phosphotransferase family protein [Sutcliffiella horikoshii]|uniref:aminoglycoside phosphotransferase family protein n=1 Tax=Sutcliffiella horikoshii TaxID=79883 RepID=UPI002040B457|nr:aminoglycoside phosphotransferase family protein [Sutcliffiella horikoshii]MCM3617484.1 aminoglycoside phosphotransferase family protein [Sutcliffiella horikoshii]